MKHRLQAINIGLGVEATLNPEWVNGIGGATFPCLTFQVSIFVREEAGSRFAASTQAVSFGMLTGELFVGSDKIGDATPVSIDRAGMQYKPYQDEIHLTLEFPLDARRIEWLEQKRSGKSMEGRLKINLAVQVFGLPQNPSSPFASNVGLTTASNIQGEIPFTIPDTHWRERVLPALGYGKVIAIELPAIAMDACKALDHSFKSLEKTQHQFLLGDYDQTAGFCRMALDRFFQPADKGDGSGKTIPKLGKNWEAKLGKATYDWLDVAFSAIKADTNKSHHSPNNHFDRLGAQMLLIVTVALVSFAASELEANGERP